MVKPIMKDVFFLGQKSEPATKADLQVGYLTGKSRRLCGYGCEYDWSEKASHYCEYGIRRYRNV